MKALFQRVSRAEVRVAGEVVGRIGAGALILLGVGHGDTDADAVKLADKVSKLRVFEDAGGKMNLAISAIDGAAFLVVSQFTLLGNTRKGNRPSFIAAAPPGEANRLYEVFMARLRELGHRVEAGAFGAMMEVELVNDGPVTLWLESSGDSSQ